MYNMLEELSNMAGSPERQGTGSYKMETEGFEMIIVRDLQLI